MFTFSPIALVTPAPPPPFCVLLLVINTCRLPDFCRSDFFCLSTPIPPWFFLPRRPWGFSLLSPLTSSLKRGFVPPRPVSFWQGSRPHPIGFPGPLSVASFRLFPGSPRLLKNTPLFLSQTFPEFDYGGLGCPIGPSCLFFFYSFCSPKFLRRKPRISLFATGPMTSDRSQDHGLIFPSCFCPQVLLPLSPAVSFSLTCFDPPNFPDIRLSQRGSRPSITPGVYLGSPFRLP